MGWWILFGLVALGLCIYWLYEDEYGWVGFVGALIGMQVLAFVAALIPMLICGALIESGSAELKETHDVRPIYALADNTGISGGFFLGCGSVDSDLKYYYVVETELGKHVESQKTESAYIVDSDTPTITTISYEWANGAWEWLGFCLKDNNYIFAIPAGSILNDYKVDLN